MVLISSAEEKTFLSGIGNNIRWLRIRRKLSQEELGFESNLDRTYIGGIERGERNPTIINIKKIADALGVPVAKIVSGDLDLDEIEKTVSINSNEKE